MTRHRSNRRIAGHELGREEVFVAIEALVKRVTQLARNVERVVTKADIKSRIPSKSRAQLELAFGSPVGAQACNAVAVDIDEAASFPLSPEKNGATVNVGLAATVAEHPEKPAATCLEPVADRSPAENGVASRVLILHDRLGGFIKPPASIKPADDQT